MGGVTYDTGALIAAERTDERMWRIHRRTLEAGVTPTVPVGVLAQAWRGGPQPQLSRLLRACEVEQLDEPMARVAGTACGQANTTDVVDATVAVGAAVRGDRVVTSDAEDIRHLTAALGAPIHVVQI